jgi:hypothetical protein
MFKAFTKTRIAAIAILSLVLLSPGALLAQYRAFPASRPGQTPTASRFQPVYRTLPVYAPGVNPNAPFYNQVNPFQLVAPGVTQQQYLYNLNQQARVISRYPPWVFGYNPYPNPVIVNAQPYVNQLPLASPYQVYNPYLYNLANPYIGY